VLEVYPQGTHKEVVRIKLFLFVGEYINYIYSIQESIGKQIQKECYKIFPVQNVLVKKFKLLKKPKFDLSKLMELY
jgi:ribosomal protein S3AE